MDEMEYRFCEIRADLEARRLEGRAMRYGDVADLGAFRERFEAGAFGDLGTADVVLNRQHQRAEPLARTGGGGLVLLDTNLELRIEATLPETRAADDVLALVRNNVLRGLSIEFKALRERFENGVRIVSRARLGAIGVVDSGAYPDAAVAARAVASARRRLWLP